MHLSPSEEAEAVFSSMHRRCVTSDYRRTKPRATASWTAGITPGLPWPPRVYPTKSPDENVTLSGPRHALTSIRKIKGRGRMCIVVNWTLANVLGWWEGRNWLLGSRVTRRKIFKLNGIKCIPSVYRSITSETWILKRKKKRKKYLPWKYSQSIEEIITLKFLFVSSQYLDPLPRYKDSKSVHNS